MASDVGSIGPETRSRSRVRPSSAMSESGLTPISGSSSKRLRIASTTTTSDVAVNAPLQKPNLTIRIIIPKESHEEFTAYLTRLPPNIPWSFTRAPNTSLDKDWVATMPIEALPENLWDRIKSIGEVKNSMSIQMPTKKSTIDLLVDVNFNGLTPLNEVEAPDVDIIAISGLEGHAFGSWKASAKHDMWLRDYLSQDLAQQDLRARIMIYGYDSKLTMSNSRELVHDYANKFLERLKAVRCTALEKRRPLIILAHCLGGILIKHALKEASIGDDDAKKVLKSCYGLLFFGSPNRGMKVDTLKAMVKGMPNERLVIDLADDSQYLRELKRQFDLLCTTLEGSRVLSFYETKETPTFRCVDGRWERTGPPAYMVHYYSATGSARNEQVHDQLALDGDHLSMVKFFHRSNQGYQTVRRHMLQLVKDAPAVIAHRFGCSLNK